MESENIPVRLFREILLWPLAVRVTPGASVEQAVARLAKCLVKPEWEPIEDPRRHLDPGGGPLPPDAYEEVVYFHPFVQRFLFPAPEKEAKRPPVRLFRRTGVTRVRLTRAADARTPARIYELDVDRINFYLFDSGIVVLVVEVSSNDGRAVLEVAPHLPLDAGSPPPRGSLTLTDAQIILNHLRHAYPPYWTGDQRGVAAECFHSVQWLCGAPGCPDVSLPVASDTAPGLRERLNVTGEPPILGHWRALLAPLPLAAYRDDPDREGFDDLRHVVDDRIPTMALIGVDDPAALPHGDIVRLCFADEPDSGMPYAEDFLGDFAAKHCYDRFWQNGKGWLNTRYLCSGYNFAVIGQAHGPTEGTFFRDIIGKHFRRHYFQLGLLNHHQKAALLTLSDAASAAIAQYAEGMAEAPDSDPARGKLRNAMSMIQARTLAFTHRFWFTDVSNQVQGQEMFRWWRERLDTQAAFDQLNREVAESNAYLSARDQDRSTQAALRLNRFAAAALALALTTGALGMNVLADGKWTKSEGWWELGMVFFATVLILLVGVLVISKDGLMRKLFGGRARWAWGVAMLIGALTAGWMVFHPPPPTLVERLAAAYAALTAP